MTPEQQEQEEEDKAFRELMETDDIHCILCDRMIGNRYQVIEHFRTRHPHIYETINNKK